MDTDEQKPDDSSLQERQPTSPTPHHHPLTSASSYQQSLFHATHMANYQPYWCLNTAFPPPSLPNFAPSMLPTMWHFMPVAPADPLPMATIAPTLPLPPRRDTLSEHCYGGRREASKRSKPSTLTKPMERCKYYMEGRCNKSDSCPFSHDFVPPRKKKLCKYFAQSRCRNGSKCPYMHGDWPCKYYHLKHKCTQQPGQCRFSHEPISEEMAKLLKETYSSTENKPGATEAELQVPQQPACKEQEEEEEEEEEKEEVTVRYYHRRTFDCSDSKESYSPSEDPAAGAANKKALATMDEKKLFGEQRMSAYSNMYTNPANASYFKSDCSDESDSARLADVADSVTVRRDNIRELEPDSYKIEQPRNVNDWRDRLPCSGLHPEFRLKSSRNDHEIGTLQEESMPTVLQSHLKRCGTRSPPKSIDKFNRFPTERHQVEKCRRRDGDQRQRRNKRQ